MITASLATIPSRIPQLQKTVESLLPQVDRLNIFLNNYTTVPEFLNHDKIQLGFGDNSIGDAGKFYWASETKGFQMYCDDDIIYLGDYVAKMKSDFAIKNESYSNGFTIVSIDTRKAKFQGLAWRTLGDFGKRKFENLIFLTRAKEKIKVIYI